MKEEHDLTGRVPIQEEDKLRNVGLHSSSPTQRRHILTQGPMPTLVDW